MSRGLGGVQRRVLEVLRGWQEQGTSCEWEWRGTYHTLSNYASEHDIEAYAVTESTTEASC